MTANTLPSGIGDLLLLAAHIGDGLALHGPWLRALPAASAFQEMRGKLCEAEDAYAVARAEKAAASARVQTADEALTAWLGKARLVVMLAKGSQWSEAWLEAGFTQRGTNVPKQMSVRVALARRVVAFFARHGEWEVSFAEVTAARGATIFAEMCAAQTRLRTASEDVLGKKCARDLAEKTLRREMRCVVIFLSVLLSPGDERWLAFGLHRPRPDAPPRAPARRATTAPAIIPLPAIAAASEEICAA